MVLENLNKYKIILASKSPRRHELLKGMGLNFEVRLKEGLEENYPDNLKAEEIPLFLAELKSKAFVNDLNADELLITADTIVWHREQVLHKPKNADDAVRILSLLSGNMHQVMTGVCVQSVSKKEIFCVTSNVYFSALSLEEIRFYIENYKPYDKAGAYGIQEWIGYTTIARIEGCFFNVMGLPSNRLYQVLKTF